jgi:hypothetical protein
MSSEEIEEYRHVLASSYGCDVNEITTDFEKIRDENDEDRDDCLWLKYRMACIINGKQAKRDIFTIKLPIPDEIRQMAEQLRQQKNQRARAGRNANRAGAIVPVGSASQPAPYPTTTPIVEDITDEVTPAAATPTQAPASPVVATRPRLKRPTRKRT